jgi:hypothetical protein
MFTRDHQLGRDDAIGRREADLVSALRYGVTAGRRQLVVPRRQVVSGARVDDPFDRHVSQMLARGEPGTDVQCVGSSPGRPMKARVAHSP